MSGQKSIIWIAGSSLIVAMLACNIGARKPAPITAGGLPSNTPIVSIEPSATETQTENSTHCHRDPRLSFR